MTSGLFAPAHPAAGSSFPTTRIQNTVPEIAIMRLSEKREQQHPGGLMPLFSLPESLFLGERASDKETANSIKKRMEPITKRKGLYGNGRHQ